jgi:large subunit ribosomal protein L7/L12
MDQIYLTRLAQLEARMRQMEATIQALCTHLDIDPAEFIPAESPETMATPIRAALLAGNKIQAIKLYREYYGVGLKEAKDAIDRYNW